MSINLTAMLPVANDYPWPPVTHPNRTEGQTQCEQILRHLRKRGHDIKTDTLKAGRKRWASYRLEGV
jgi:hypothetical protein